MLEKKINICYLPAGRSVWWKTVTEGLKMLPEAAGRGQHLQARGKHDWNWLKFYRERNTGLRAITAPSYKQPNKLSQLPNTQLNLLTVTFLAILKWTEINLLWLIVDGCVKKGKRLTITVNFQEQNFGSEEKIRPVGRIVKSWTGHVRMINQSNLRI